MKLNKKGFTLIELLAVVVILLAISVMAISSISAAIERNKVKQDESKKAVIESYAEVYYADHKNSLSNQNICISVSTLNLTEKELAKAEGNNAYFNGYVIYKQNGVSEGYKDICPDNYRVIS